MKAQDRMASGRTRSARVRSVSQVLLTFQSNEPEIALGEIRNEALRWLANRAGRPLPQHARDGESFDLLEVGAQPITALGLDNMWCFRISDADREVARRSWTTEVATLLSADGNVMFGCRLQCAALGAAPPFDPSIPGIVTQVVDHCAAYLDGRRVTLTPWLVDSEAEVDELEKVLLNPDRTRPVIVISMGDKGGLDGPGIIDAEKLTRLTVGAAHVVKISSKASHALTNRVGKAFSVFHQAIRTYRPALNIDEDSPGKHPIAFPSTVEEFSDEGPSDFTRFLVERTLRATVVSADIYRQLPSFADIHAMALKQKRNIADSQGASDSDLLVLALEENDSLDRKLTEETETYNGLLQSVENDLEQVESERDHARTNCHALQARLLHLEAALQATGKLEDAPVHSSFDELEEWCQNYLSGRVHVMPRAFRIATKSGFENPQLAYRALLILRDYFVPMKREGGIEKKAAYEQALAEFGLEDSPSFTGARAGEQGDEYKVNFDGRYCYLNRHIKGSSSREERFGFRLYFFWDRDSQQAVVGAFPSHLKTRAS